MDELPAVSDTPSLAERLASIRNDIRQGALPNAGAEKKQWLDDLDAAGVLAARVEQLEAAIKAHREAGKRPFGERTTQYPSDVALWAALEADLVPEPRPERCPNCGSDEVDAEGCVQCFIQATTAESFARIDADEAVPEPPAEQPKVKPCEFCGGPMVPGDGHRMGPKTGGPWLVCRHCGAQRPAPSPEEPTP
jgi:hypothetical protein